MTIPTTDKTWQFSTNLVVAGNNPALFLLQLKNALKGFGSGAWTVSGSSNAVAGGMDATDRWTTAANISWAGAGVAHSWIVLKQTGINSGFEILIDCSSSSTTNTAYMNVSWATSGFTGGNSTTAPTATGSIALLTSALWYSGTTMADNITHVMMSTDGECTRIMSFLNSVGTCHFFWMFDKAKNPVTNWAIPALCITVGGNTTHKTEVTYLTDTTRISGKHGATAMTMFMTGDGVVANLVVEYGGFNAPSQFNQEVTFFPIGVVSETTGCKGRHGEIFDLWWGVGNNIHVGNSDGTYPNDSTRKFWQCGSLIFPWTGLVSSPGELVWVRY
jgi:hypothetical protein